MCVACCSAVDLQQPTDAADQGAPAWQAWQDKGDRLGGHPAKPERPKRDKKKKPGAEVACTSSTGATKLSFSSIPVTEGVPGQFVAFLLQADLNRDGRADLVASIGIKPDPQGPPPLPSDASRLAIWLGTGQGGQGTFVQTQEVPVAGLSHGALADVNHDGRVDLVALAHDAQGGVALRVFCGQKTAPFISQSDCGYSSLPLADTGVKRDMQLSSPDSSGWLRVAVADMDRTTGRSTLEVFHVAKNAHASRTLTALLTAQEQAAVALEFLAVGDFDGDGQPDLVATNGTATTIDGDPLPQVFVFKAAFGAAPAPITVQRLSYTVPSHQWALYAQPRRPVLADFDGNQRMDIAVINYGVNDFPTSGKPAFFFQEPNGALTFVAHGARLGGEPIEGYAVDLDGNCLPDIVGMASDGAGIAPLLQRKAREFELLQAGSIQGAHRDWLVHGDYNRDGKVDLVTATSAGSPPSIPIAGHPIAPIVVHLQQ